MPARQNLQFSIAEYMASVERNEKLSIEYKELWTQ